VPTEPIESDGNVSIFVGIYTQSNSDLAIHEFVGALHTHSPLRRPSLLHSPESRGEADITAMGLLLGGTSFYEVTVRPGL
jgi:hypothetical protein